MSKGYGIGMGRVCAAVVAMLAVGLGGCERAEPQTPGDSGMTAADVGVTVDVIGDQGGGAIDVNADEAAVSPDVPDVAVIGADVDSGPGDVGCAPPRRMCPDGACVDPNTDLANCGGCGQACAPANATGTCVSGVCGVMACATGFRDCDGMASNGCEVDTRTSVTNCGSCGTTCTATNGTPACVAGACAVRECNPGYRNCDDVTANGCEVDTNTSMSHCGACGRACASGQVCSMGVCQIDCAAPVTRCGEACFNLLDDESHCGSCTTACRADQICTAGSCVCPAGQEVCGGTCQAVGAACTSTGNGGCEQAGTVMCVGTAARCGASPRTSGACTSPVGGMCNTSGQCACPTGQTNCGGVCRTIGGACTSPGSGGCEQTGITICDGTSTRCNAVVRTSGACSTPIGGVCGSSGVCACPVGQSNCSGTCRATGATCTSPTGSGGCQQNGTVICLGNSTTCSASPRTSGTCATPIGGTCNGSGNCVCSSAQLNCSNTCQATGTCTTAGSGGCQQTGTYVCSGTGRVCSVSGPRTSGHCPTSTSANVCNGAGACVCPPSAPSGWSFTGSSCGSIRSTAVSTTWGHCCGGFCGQIDPWSNSWSPPSCPTGYRYDGCRSVHVSGGGSESVSGCTLTQRCNGLDGSEAYLYAVCAPN